MSETTAPINARHRAFHGATFRLSKKDRIIHLHGRGCSYDATAKLAHTSINYVRCVLSDADLLRPGFEPRGPERGEPTKDPDILARREHVERRKLLFRKAAGL